MVWHVSWYSQNQQHSRKFDMAKFFNEMTADVASSPDTLNLTRAHYRDFDLWLKQQTTERLQRKRAEADLSFRRVGITFAVYGDDAGTERLIPFDIIPRIIPAHEWQQLQTGLVQRVQALNMFIHDVYHDQNIIKAGIIPPEQIYKNEHYGLGMKAFQLHQISMLTSQALILYVQVPASFTSWKTTYGYRPVCRICWKIAR